METIRTKNFTDVDMFNLPTAKRLQDVKTTDVLEVTDACVMESVNKDGEIIPNGFLKLANGELIGTISPSVIQSITPLISLLESSPRKIKVVKKTSNQNREFMLLQLV